MPAAPVDALADEPDVDPLVPAQLPLLPSSVPSISTRCPTYFWTFLPVSVRPDAVLDMPLEPLVPLVPAMDPLDELVVGLDEPAVPLADP